MRILIWAPIIIQARITKGQFANFAWVCEKRITDARCYNAQKLNTVSKTAWRDNHQTDWLRVLSKYIVYKNRYQSVWFQYIITFASPDASVPVLANADSI